MSSDHGLSLPQELLDRILHYALKDAYPDYITKMPKEDREWLSDDPLFRPNAWQEENYNDGDPKDPVYCHGGRIYVLLVLKLAAIDTRATFTCDEIFQSKL